MYLTRTVAVCVAGEWLAVAPPMAGSGRGSSQGTSPDRWTDTSRSLHRQQSMRRQHSPARGPLAQSAHAAHAAQAARALQAQQQVELAYQQTLPVQHMQHQGQQGREPRLPVRASRAARAARPSPSPSRCVPQPDDEPRHVLGLRILPNGGPPRAALLRRLVAAGSNAVR